MITNLELSDAKCYASKAEPTLWEKKKLVQLFYRTHGVQAQFGHIIACEKGFPEAFDNQYKRAKDFFRKQIEQDETILNSQKELRNEDGQSDN